MTTLAELIAEHKKGSPLTDGEREDIANYLEALNRDRTPEQRAQSEADAKKFWDWIEKLFLGKK